MAIGQIIGDWFSGGVRDREIRETRVAWEETERLWRASPLAKRKSYEFTNEIMTEAVAVEGRSLAQSIVVALTIATDDIFRAESIGALTPNWELVENDAAGAVEFRQMFDRRRNWAVNFDTMFGVFRKQMLSIWDAVTDALPESCFSNGGGEGQDSFEVPLIELVEDPAELIEALFSFAYDVDARRLGQFVELREWYGKNILIASGLSLTAQSIAVESRLVFPTGQKDRSSAKLADMYLGGTPLRDFLETPVPFHIADEARFEHCHIVGGTGHGKTQLMQRMIHADLVRAQHARRSVVVIDSQGDLINKLVRLDLFSPETRGSLADRLILIDPSDVEFPASLNLFDAHLERADGYRPVDRERVLNGVIELYEIFFGGLLGAELTQKQGVIFKYLARLMLTIPGATIHTLMRLMEDGKPFRPNMEKLEGSAAYFFATEFFHPSFTATKKQILRRLWGVLSTPVFERMFAQKRNKLDLFEAMNDGKIILINTAKDLLKGEGSQLFGRFFIALLSQAALERSTIDEDERTPTFVYVDEAQEYFDDRIETILNQARKYAISFHCAHQSLDQPSPSVRSALLSNTSFKCVGGVSAKDARLLASELRTTPEFIEGMRRRKDRTEFAVWLKQLTPSAIRLTVPLGFLEKQPILAEEEYLALLKRNRERYCGTFEDVERLSPQFPASQAQDRPAHPPERGSDAQTTRDSPEEPVIHVAHQRDEQRPVRHTQPEPPPRRVTPPETGKGGSQHKYVQHLIKQLADERGFRTVIEAPVTGGQVDVALYRSDLSIACEISVTSTAGYEAQNLAKCLRADFSRVWAIANDAKHRRAIEKAAQTRLSAEEFAKIEFLTTEDVILLLGGLVEPSTEETINRGYKVKVNRKTVSPEEAAERRKTITRVVAESLRELE